LFDKTRKGVKPFNTCPIQGYRQVTYPDKRRMVHALYGAWTFSQLVPGIMNIGGILDWGTRAKSSCYVMYNYMNGNAFLTVNFRLINSDEFAVTPW